MNNPPAFPRTGYTDTRTGTLPDGDEVIRHNDGMTLRDYFAAAAMTMTFFKGLEGMNDEKSATAAYQIADAMLKAREQ